MQNVLGLHYNEFLFDIPLNPLYCSVSTVSVSLCLLLLYMYLNTFEVYILTPLVDILYTPSLLVGSALYGIKGYQHIVRSSLLTHCV